MNPKTLISLNGAVISNPLRRLAAPVNFELREGEHIAIVGPNGSGKSTLLEMIRGGFYLREGTLRHNLDDESYRAIRTVEFDNAYSTSETQYYYQQRWQAFEREAAPLAGELLGKGEENRQLFDILDIWPLLGKEIITLSSGELRRFSIARALLKRPQVLVMESPFIGLDPPTRKILCDLMSQLASSLGISFIMALTSADQIPPVATHVYFMDNGIVSEKIHAVEACHAPDDSALQPENHGGQHCPSNDLMGHIDSRRDFRVGYEIDSESIILPHLRESQRFNKVVEMRNINISYGERQLFKDLNWTVRSGEKWNVTGPNGSGKSTLLSLVNADNPRAYSLDITLFDRRRGTGESIWDIKRHIGFLSSEMHSSFITSETVLDIVRSGLGHSGDGHMPRMKVLLPDAQPVPSFANAGRKSLHGLGCNMPVTDNDQYIMYWLELFGAENLAHRNYNTLSSGEQRYILLIRAFVKDPDLLILDEPFQGLDPERRHRAAAVVEAFCARSNKTLVFVTHYIEEIPGIVTNTLQL